MDKSIPMIILSVLAVISTIFTIVLGLGAYVAVNGLDLLVTAKKTLPKYALIMLIVSAILWGADLIYMFVVKPYKKS
ncbi:MAG: hypothetical protein K6E53_00990 [Lachnospiraceae bacterium]|nr:hypothetical protein [Lachnospiraceae bacterium]